MPESKIPMAARCITLVPLRSGEFGFGCIQGRVQSRLFHTNREEFPIEEEGWGALNLQEISLLRVGSHQRHRFITLGAALQLRQVQTTHTCQTTPELVYAHALGLEQNRSHFKEAVLLVSTLAQHG